MVLQDGAFGVYDRKPRTWGPLCYICAVGFCALGLITLVIGTWMFTRSLHQLKMECRVEYVQKVDEPCKYVDCWHYEWGVMGSDGEEHQVVGKDRPGKDMREPEQISGRSYPCYYYPKKNEEGAPVTKKLSWNRNNWDEVFGGGSAFIASFYVCCAIGRCMQWNLKKHQVEKEKVRKERRGSQGTRRKKRSSYYSDYYSDYSSRYYYSDDSSRYYYSDSEENQEVEGGKNEGEMKPIKKEEIKKDNQEEEGERNGGEMKPIKSEIDDEKEDFPMKARAKSIQHANRKIAGKRRRQRKSKKVEGMENQSSST